MLPFGKQILIAEDDTDDRECYQHAFHAMPDAPPVRFALSGSELLQSLDHSGENLPAVIVVDNRLPDMKGEEVLLRLKEDQRYRHIPVIIISGSCGTQLTAHLVGLGACGCREKPHSLAGWIALAHDLTRLAPGDAQCLGSISKGEAA